MPLACAGHQRRGRRVNWLPWRRTTPISGTAGMGAAAILCIGGRLLMHPLGQIAGGPAMFIPPVIRIAPDAPHEDVGRGVRAALAGAQHDVPPPTDARTRERLAPLQSATSESSALPYRKLVIAMCLVWTPAVSTAHPPAAAAILADLDALVETCAHHFPGLGISERAFWSSALGRQALSLTGGDTAAQARLRGTRQYAQRYADTLRQGRKLRAEEMKPLRKKCLEVAGGTP